MRRAEPQISQVNLLRTVDKFVMGFLPYILYKTGDRQPYVHLGKWAIKEQCNRSVGPCLFLWIEKDRRRSM
jgi:hypothetical protein